MKIKTFSLVIALIVIILMAGCARQLTTEELQKKIITENAKLGSYSVELITDLNMETRYKEMNEDMTSQLSYTGDIDRINKNAFLKGIIKSSFLGMKTEMETDNYILDGYVYVKVLNQWVKQKLDDDFWLQQDQISQMAVMLNSGTIERLEDATIDGTSYYVVKVKPSLKKIAEMTAQQLQGIGSSDLYDELINENTVQEFSSTLWINKKTFVIEKTATKTKMVIDYSKFSNGTLNSSVIVDSNMSLRIYDINKQVSVVLPLEAAKAIDMSGLNNFSEDDERSANFATGNIIATIPSP